VSKPSPPLPVLLVTGMSGAGRSTVLKALRDLGYEAVDNLPLSFLDRLIDLNVAAPRRHAAIAVSVDFRTREFVPASMAATVAALRARGDAEVSTLFLDCTDEVLTRRFTETRRRHPLDDSRSVPEGIRLERQRLQPLIESADMTIDTTDMSARELAGLVAERFAPARGQAMALTVLSFSYRGGLPREADLVFDVRFLANPHYQPELRPLTGRDPAVANFISRDPACPAFLDRLAELVLSLLPHYRREGKSYLTIAIGCTGGRHRSVFVAERLAERLRPLEHAVILRHRELPDGARHDADAMRDRGA